MGRGTGGGCLGIGEEAAMMCASVEYAVCILLMSTITPARVIFLVLDVVFIVHT